MADKQIREIVAAKINGSTITNNIQDIITAAKNNTLNEVFEREQIIFMASFDLGKNWKDLSEGKTLFYMVDGKPQYNNPFNVV